MQFIRFVFDILILPFLILGYLSLPRLYAVLRFAEPGDYLTSSYYNLNLTLAYLLAASYFLGKQVFYRSTKLIFLVVLQVIFIIRIVDIESFRVFHMSFSPAFFANLELESFRVMAYDYWWGLILLGLYLIVFFLFFMKRAYPPYGKRAGTILTVLMLLILVRSAVVLKKQSWHSSADFAVQLLVEQAYEYYRESDFLDSLQWTETELEVINNLGFDLKPVSFDYNAVSLQKPNLILIYLEGFQAEFTRAGGSKIKGLTPNLDRFAGNNTYLPNFYNAVTPTINALISTQCGLLPRFGNYSLDKIVYAPNILCLPDYLKGMGYQQTMLLGSSPVFSGIKKYAEFHQYDEVIGRYAIKERYPEYRKGMTTWGINDYDLYRVAVKTVDRLQKSSPFHLTLFTLDTHPPFDTSPECPVFSKDNKLFNAIHCSDYGFGMFYDHLGEIGLLDNSMVVLAGDHMPHGGGREYGRVFAAFRAPGFAAGEGRVIDTISYSPDIIATILDMMGTGLTSKLVGKSVLSSRTQFQHLVSPGFEIYNGKFRSAGKCDKQELLKTTLRDETLPLSDCQREKVLKKLDSWVLHRGF